MSFARTPTAFDGRPVAPMFEVPPGNVFWVHSGTGSDTNKGTHARPFATLDYAIGRCTANNGDVIYLKAGHSETITAAAGVNADVAGVSIVGLGRGSDRPTFNFTTSTAATFAVAAANVSVSGCLFTSGIANLVKMMPVTGTDCKIAHNEFREGTSSMLVALSVEASRAHVHHNLIRMDEPDISNNGDNALSIDGGLEGVLVEHNVMVGDFDGSVMQRKAGNGDFMLLRQNYMENTKVGLTVLFIHSSGTNVGAAVLDNRFAAVPGAGLLVTQMRDHLSAGNLSLVGETGAGEFPDPGYQQGERSGRVVLKQTGSMASGFGVCDDPVMFTVTGVVAARVFGVVTTAITSTSNNGTLSVGVADSNALLVPAITMNGTNGAQHDVLATATTTVNGDVLANGGEYVVIANGVDIQAFVATNAMTAGAVDFYCEWYPISSDGNVVAA